jgi:hypothetical protein
MALLFHDLDARRGWVVSTTPRPLDPRERPGTNCTGGWVDPRAGLDVCEKSRPTGILFFLLVSCTLLVWKCSGLRRKTERLRAVDFSIMKNPTVFFFFSILCFNVPVLDFQ